MSGAQIFDPQALAPLTMTEAAIDHLRRQIQKRGHGQGLRLSIKTNGCSGKGYQPEIADHAQPDELSFQVAENLHIFVSQQDYDQYLKGVTIDYQRQGLNAKFIFHNPNEKGSCGCGESFTV